MKEEAQARWNSRLRLSDVVSESLLEVSRRPARTVMTGLGVALGAAAVVATVTLVSTIRFQVSDQFDARRATQIELRTRSGDTGAAWMPTGFPPDSTTVERVKGLSGVEGVAVVRETREQLSAAINQVLDPTMTPAQTKIYGLNADALDLLELDLFGPGWTEWHDRTGQRVAVLSSATASQLGAPDIQVGDRIHLEGETFTVAGLLNGSPRLPGLAGGILIPLGSVDRFELDTDRDRVIVVTAAGAAQQLATVLPIAFSPNMPDGWIAYAPQDDATLRLAVDDHLQTFALALGGIVIALGVVTIGNATLTSVMARIHEIGLRRALGARPSHIVTHIVVDAALIGLVGGVIGAALGLLATLSVAAVQGWVPVIEPRILAIAVVGGFLAGAVAGVYPSRVGSRLEPTEALRRE